MGGVLIEENLFVKYNIVTPDSPEGQKIHNFLLSRAEALIGKIFDFDTNPVVFVMSDSEEPNAFFAQAGNKTKKPKRSEYDDIRYIRNPLDIPVICVTKGLIDLVDNIDQLDYVLGHELTHMILRGYGIKHNSKGEEEIADLHGLDLVYDAGSDPKQALKFEEKLAEYAETQKEKERKKRYRHSRKSEEEVGVDWSEILDVHMTHNNRTSALEASLTRLSHLIDERTPSNFDKSVFAVEYTDPIEAFLKENNYKDQKALGKLKILVDCVEHLSSHVPAEDFFQSRLDALSRDLGGEDSYSIEWEQKEIQKRIDAGYEGYFLGKTVEKTYQQKIAWMAENVIEQVKDERSIKGNSQKPAIVRPKDLDVYLQNQAYSHMRQNGYPKAGDLNYLEASGVLYTYFHTLFMETGFDRRDPQPEKNDARVLPQIEIDLNVAKAEIHEATSIEELKAAIEKLDGITKIWKDLNATSYGDGRRGYEKFENLSSVGGPLGRHVDFDSIAVYGELKAGDTIPWNNLVEIAQQGEEAKEYVVSLLKAYRIEDFRITHGESYIRRNNYSCYAIDDEGTISDRKVEEYELDYIVNRELVLQAYDYVRDYFQNEEALSNKISEALLHFTDDDFSNFVEVKEISGGPRADRISVADKKSRDLIYLHNALPIIKNKTRHFSDPNKSVRSLMSGQYMSDSPMPGTDKHLRLKIDGNLFEFDNPVFQEHFGGDFKEKIFAGKASRQQQMFDTVLKTLQNAANLWKEASSEAKRLDEQRSKLWKQDDYDQDELHKLHEEHGLHKSKADAMETKLYNFAFSIFERQEYWYSLNRLTLEQRKTLAEIIVKDEEGLFMEVFNEERYADFCDFMDVLSEQTDKVISGDYELTDSMKIAAKNLGYRQANTKEELHAFVDENYEHKYHSSKYKWYLNAFDAMRHLEKSREVDISSLAKAISCTAEDGRSHSMGDSEEIVRARRDNYIKFVKDSNLIKLLTKAIRFKGNYQNLSFDEMVETADDLVSLRNQMSELLVQRKSDPYHRKPDEITIEPEHKKFLNLLDKKIKGLLIQAEGEALQQENSFDKMVNLYHLYHSKGDHYSDEVKRRTYLSEIDKNGKRRARISTLSEKPDFWPEDTLEHIKAYVFAKNTFIDDVELENEILNNIFDKLDMLPSGKKKNECFYILLDKTLRAPYPEGRERLFSMYAEDIESKLGQDDGSERYQKRLAIYLKALDDSEVDRDWDTGRRYGLRDGLLSNAMSAADRYMLLKQVSDTIISQEQTSEMMKTAGQVKLNSEKMVESYLYGIGVDYLTSEMDEDPDTANRFIQFLNSKGEMPDCEEISSHIEKIVRKRHKGGRGRDTLETALKNIKPVNCKILYENFWSAPLEARAVIISRMLKSAVNEEVSNDNGEQQSWERVFDVVMDNIISPDDVSRESKYARDIMHSYIKARSDYERELILSAMMVANRNIGKDAGNVGKALKLFLENMGPAEIKLGQAISSHPDTPESIRVELQELKNSADKPARWTLYDWIKNENIPEELWKDKYLGKILGSASYYTTVALGEDKVLRILRPEAREKATKGFRVISGTIEDLKEKDVSSELDYKELTSSVSEMVTQAARMSSIETDHDIGQTQYEDAQKIYNGVTINSGSESFTLKVMNWHSKGQNWMVMDRANGPTFNDMPEDTPEQISYKKSFAKGYIVFEIMNILSGDKFDHDKHGAQLCIDSETNEVGIFDTGAMALEAPTPDEQKMLGNVIYDVIKQAIVGEQPLASLGNILSDKIDDLHKNSINTQYLVEVKKGLLALGDFFKVLDQEDLKDIMPDIGMLSDLSEHVGTGVTERMSFAEKAQVKVLMATKISPAYNNVTIARTMPEVTSNVANVNTQPAKQRKASWLQTAFENDNEQPMGTTSQLTQNLRKVPVTVRAFA